MIYKFIDNNGSEISVNSLSSLQALVDSETVKENTKVKAGLRGKWTTASKIQELVFIKEVIPEAEPEEVIPEAEPEEVLEAEAEEVIPEAEAEEVIPEAEPEEEKSEYELEEDKIDHTYDDENIKGISAGASIKLGFKKIFDFSGRASRSEFWWFYLTYIFLSFLVIFIIMFLAIMSDPNISDSALDSMSNIGYLTGIGTLGATVRRLHDRDISGWAILLFIIPLVNIYLIVLLFLKGTEGKNKFGEYPLKFK
jgi:uncharacterized membrane protein YhaH (DUF805 family)